MRTVAGDTAPPQLLPCAFCWELLVVGVAVRVSEPACRKCVNTGAWGVYG